MVRLIKIVFEISDSSGLYATVTFNYKEVAQKPADVAWNKNSVEPFLKLHSESV